MLQDSLLLTRAHCWLAFRDSLVSDCAFTQLMSIRLVLQLLK